MTYVLYLLVAVLVLDSFKMRGRIGKLAELAKQGFGPQSQGKLDGGSQRSLRVRPARPTHSRRQERLRFTPERKRPVVRRPQGGPRIGDPAPR